MLVYENIIFKLNKFIITGKQLPVKEEQAERETLIKALEENLKAVVENEEDPAEMLEEEEEESRPEEDEQEEDDEMDEDFIEQPIKKEPKAYKTVKQSTHRNEPQGPQPASYIMKLFDRSVNLAQFEEDTPLYPLCRAWMKNQPRAQIIRPDKIVSDDPLDIQEAQDGDVVEMPKVRIRKGKNPARSEVRINKKDFDKQIDVEVWTKEKLLDEHRVVWQAEKERHIKNSRMFEEKHFAANLELIESLIKESEE